MGREVLSVVFRGSLEFLFEPGTVGFCAVQLFSMFLQFLSEEVASRAGFAILPLQSSAFVFHPLELPHQRLVVGLGTRELGGEAEELSPGFAALELEMVTLFADRGMAPSQVVQDRAQFLDLACEAPVFALLELEFVAQIVDFTQIPILGLVLTVELVF